VSGDLPRGYRTHGNVAIRDHANEAVVLADGEHACIDLCHRQCGLADGFVGIGDTHVPCHCVT